MADQNDNATPPPMIPPTPVTTMGPLPPPPTNPYLTPPVPTPTPPPMIPPMFGMHGDDNGRTTKEGYREENIVNEHGIGLTIRNPESPVSAAGRDRSGDGHMEIPHTALGGSLIDSAVSGVKLNGVTYTVQVSSGKGGILGDNQYVGIARDDNSLRNLVSVNESTMSNELKQKVLAAVSPNGDGGKALTYKEAEGILQEGLRHNAPVATGHDSGGKNTRG